jgi:hypothetical protein
MESAIDIVTGNQMARKARSSRTAKQRLQKEYRAAVAEYHLIANYLKAATGILSNHERQLLKEFLQLAKRKQERLLKAISRTPTPIRSILEKHPKSRHSGKREGSSEGKRD